MRVEYLSASVQFAQGGYECHILSGYISLSVLTLIRWDLKDYRMESDCNHILMISDQIRYVTEAWICRQYHLMINC